jgi:hypothetical protein
MRDIMVKDYHNYHQHNYFPPYTLKLSVNWPTGKCLVADSDDVVVGIEPSFEEHINNMDNWTLGSCFATAFPNLQGTFIVKD